MPVAASVTLATFLTVTLLPMAIVMARLSAIGWALMAAPMVETFRFAAYSQSAAMAWALPMAIVKVRQAPAFAGMTVAMLGMLWRGEAWKTVCLAEEAQLSQLLQQMPKTTSSEQHASLCCDDLSPACGHVRGIFGLDDSVQSLFREAESECIVSQRNISQVLPAYHAEFLSASRLYQSAQRSPRTYEGRPPLREPSDRVLELQLGS
jgi:hypothetical protein